MKEYHALTPTQQDAKAGPGPVQERLAVVRCFVCHRLLRDEKSIERGCGPTCAARIGLVDQDGKHKRDDNVVPLFPLPDSAKRRVTIHVKQYRRPRVTCDVCHRRRTTSEIHPVSLGEDPAVLAVCEPCISAIVRYGEHPVRDYLQGRTRSRREVS